MADTEVRLDHQRSERLGFDEAILCPHKSAEQLVSILDQADARAVSLLLTRLSAEQLTALPAGHRDRIDYDEPSRTAFYGGVHRGGADNKVSVAMVSAGSSDVGVAREAVRTLTYYGVGCREIYDVGVAGIWRLMDRVDDIRALPVVIAVAGMDAALPSVIGGLTPGVVIAVPTSTGYGVATGGHTALNAVLASCAPGVLVVNIDNGYGAACAAIRVLRQTQE